MKITSLQEMKELEEETYKNFGLNEQLIIENVGVESANYIVKHYLECKEFKEIVIFVGKGNNGADGLALGRHLVNLNYSVRAFLLFPENEYSPQLKLALHQAQAFGVHLTEIRDPEHLSSYFSEVQDQVFVVDAIFGTGIHHPLASLLTEIISIINHKAKLVVSIDIPSGVNGDTGLTGGHAIMAHETLAIGLPKQGHFLGEGPKFRGKLHVLKASFPNQLLLGGDKRLLNATNVGRILSKRNKFGHKNLFGHCLAIGGSRGLTGAIQLASMSALKVGTGLVSIATWEENYSEVTCRIMPEIMTMSIGPKKSELDEFIKKAVKYDSIVLGPGLGQTSYSRDLVLSIIGQYNGPLVLDADAINVLNLEKDKDLLKNRKAPTILTPHFGEFAKFIKIDKGQVIKNPLKYLTDLVESIYCAVLLKGPCTYLAMSNGEIYFNDSPNDGMATGGTGDVLAGILGGLIAQRSTEFSNNEIFNNKNWFYDSLAVGVVAHSLAGKLAADKIGARAMTASSIVEHLSSAFCLLEEKNI